MASPSGERCAVMTTCLARWTLPFSSVTDSCLNTSSMVERYICNMVRRIPTLSNDSQRHVGGLDFVVGSWPCWLQPRPTTSTFRAPTCTGTRRPPPVKPPRACSPTTLNWPSDITLAWGKPTPFGWVTTKSGKAPTAPSPVGSGNTSTFEWTDARGPDLGGQRGGVGRVVPLPRVPTAHPHRRGTVACQEHHALHGVRRPSERSAPSRV